MKKHNNLNIVDTASFDFRELIIVIRRCKFIVNKLSLHSLYYKIVDDERILVSKYI